MAEAFRNHRVRQLEEHAAAPKWEDPSLVFATMSSAPLDPRNVLRTFRTVAARAALPPHFTFHSLRHCAASLMLALEIQTKVVQETLGHGRIAVTMDIYSHLMPHLQDQAAARMDRLLAAH